VKDKEEKSSPEITRIPREAGEKYMSEVQEKKKAETSDWFKIQRGTKPNAEDTHTIHQ